MENSLQCINTNDIDSDELIFCSLLNTALDEFPFVKNELFYYLKSLFDNCNTTA